MEAAKTAWFGSDVAPVRIGYYEVRGPEHWNSRGHLIGRPFRYWNGSSWRAWKDGPISIFGSHMKHEWRCLAADPAQS